LDFGLPEGDLDLITSKGRRAVTFVNLSDKIRVDFEVSDGGED
jgi:hypothetical protein